jgi:hypothetical protein
MADDGQTIPARLGDRIVVELVACAGTTWAGPSSSNPQVLTRISPMAATLMSSTFTAVGVGTAVIAASPLHSPCPTTVPRFSVTVVVGGG